MRHLLWTTLFLGIVLGCGADVRQPPPQREYPFDDDPRLAREHAFWERVRVVEGDWAEYKPSLSELVDSADAVVVARLVSVEPGRTVHGDANTDVYAEMLVKADVSEVLRDTTAGPSVSFSLSLLNVASLEELDETLASAQAALPIDRVLLVLRQRKDADYYRVVNGYGIWASTARSVIDAPLEREAPIDRAQDFVYEGELKGLRDIEQLIDSLR
jgi:hypothetical protein